MVDGNSARPPAEVLFRDVREQLALGASQDKPVAGGSVSSIYDPLADIELMADPARNFVLIMKDWVVRKNTPAAD